MTDKATTARRAKTAAGVGAVGIAAALAAILQGKPVDCTERARCQRELEGARAELLCQKDHVADPRAHLECVNDVLDGWDEANKKCGAFDPKTVVVCSKYAAEFPIDPEVKK